MAKVLIAAAREDFDPTEVAIPWWVLSEAGHEVHFATADGKPARADEIMLTGEGLDPWAVVPGLGRLRVVGRFLGADANARTAYARLEHDARFLAPIPYSAVRVGEWTGLVLPGGHRARGIQPYLEDLALQRVVVSMFNADKAVGAICHGTVVAARALSEKTGKSILSGRRTTSLTWAQERLATRIARITRFWDPNYYRTYVEEPTEPKGYRSVEAEVTRALACPTDYCNVAKDDPDYRRKTDGLHRDTPSDCRPAFVVRDGRYVSARWPGDAHTFAKTLDEVLRSHPASISES